MKDAKMGDACLKDLSNLKEIFDTLLPSFTLEEGGKIPPPGQVKVDGTRLRANIERLLEGHSVQHPKYMLGAMALLRHFFGKSVQAAFTSIWVKDRSISVPLEISLEDRKAIDKFYSSLERKIRASPKKTNL